MKYPEDLKYTEEHTWLRIEGKKGRVGITYYAQEQLKEIVFVELPEIGATVKYMEPFGVVESAKATSDLYSPVTGTVVEVNEDLHVDPGLINRDPYGKGWMILVEIEDLKELEKLLSDKDYRRYIEKE